jgi:sterol desaturase/sphingolipid hydroxylase (fatty acid hydroxylase superfamily)
MNIAEINTIWIPAAFILFILILFISERIFPLRKEKSLFKVRLVINIVISLFSFLIAFFLIAPSVKNALGWTTKENFGLLYLTELPFIIEGIIAFLLMDLAFYYWHLLNHKIPFLWRFHNVHHIDPDLDITTAFRFHFGEIGMSAGFRVIQVSLIGISPLAFIIYESCFTANTLFHHSNIRMPIKVERILNKLLVTPRMHGIHHSQIKNETNSNYSTVFPWWDWIHKTIRLNIPQKNIVIGIPGYSKGTDNNLWQVLLLPFRKQRKYWTVENREKLENDNSLKERFKLEE